MALALDTPVGALQGIGPARADALRGAGIQSLGDLIRKHTPFRYEDRTCFSSVAGLREGRQVVIRVEIVSVSAVRTRVRRFRILELLVRDDSASMIVKFFNQPYLEKVLQRGQQVVMFGEPRRDSYSAGLVMQNPEFEIQDGDGEDSIHTGRIVPVYRRLGAFHPRTLRTTLYGVLQELGEAEQLPEVLPPEVVRRYDFPSRMEALRRIHFPEPRPGEASADLMERLERRDTRYHQRLIFEEFFRFQLGLLVTRSRRRLQPKQRTVRVDRRVREAVKSILPFHPTGAQKRVLGEIVRDLTSSSVMTRLLQGDVGSGKTIVALQAQVVVMENGYQTALMAPTEILAEQHCRAFARRLADTPYRIAFLTGAVKGKARREALEAIRSGEARVVVGTHAIFQKGVEFQNLGLVVIDEQHRFGVLQRSRLMQKGERPDTLVMTATPIPRTLALTLYGDLDLSLIDEMPPGRQPIRTILKSGANREEVYRLVRRQLAAGRQAYLVYPLIEESEKVDLQAAVEAAEHLRTEVFAEFEVGLLHGRLPSEEKDALMRRFSNGEVQVLVATTVVEVGIDVPNATIMVVEHADRFGLSQLHQLRGRIGRGEHRSYCILMFGRRVSPEARERLEVMRRSSDGFEIAEKDLELRGPGEFLGTRQSGLPGFLFANFVRDRKLLDAARLEAEQYLARLEAEGTATPARLTRLLQRWRREFFLSEVG